MSQCLTLSFASFVKANNFLTQLIFRNFKINHTQVNKNLLLNLFRLYISHFQQTEVRELNTLQLACKIIPKRVSGFTQNSSITLCNIITNTFHSSKGLLSLGR